jgi:hypothetical protein
MLTYYVCKSGNKRHYLEKTDSCFIEPYFGIVNQVHDFDTIFDGLKIFCNKALNHLVVFLSKPKQAQRRFLHSNDVNVGDALNYSLLPFDVALVTPRSQIVWCNQADKFFEIFLNLFGMLYYSITDSLIKTLD